jgi:hypothetical protein
VGNDLTWMRGHITKSIEHDGPVIERAIAQTLHVALRLLDGDVTLDDFRAQMEKLARIMQQETKNVP